MACVVGDAAEGSGSIDPAGGDAPFATSACAGFGRFLSEMLTGLLARAMMNLAQ